MAGESKMGKRGGREEGRKWEERSLQIRGP
jgi:hypothetical protein